MANNLIIHAGCHKTGTTSLQGALYFNRDLLAEENIYTIRIGEKRNNWSIVNNSWNDEEKFKQNGCKVNLLSAEKIIQESKLINSALTEKTAEKINDKLFIFSSENLSWIFRKSEIQKLKNELILYFDNISVIFYVRRQDLLLRSHHGQGAGSKPARAFYGNSLNPNIKLANHFDLYLDFQKRIKNWSNVFGGINVKVYVMDREKLKGNDITTDFFSNLGFNNIADILDTSNTQDSNSSSKIREKILRLGMSSIKSRKDKKILKDLINKASTASSQAKIQCNNDWSNMVLEHYQESNKLLSEEYNLGHKWYAVHTKEEKTNWMWSEEEVNLILKNLLKEIVSIKSTNIE